MCLEKPFCGEYVKEEEIDEDLSFDCNFPYKFARYDSIFLFPQ